MQEKSAAPSDRAGASVVTRSPSVFETRQTGSIRRSINTPRCRTALRLWRARYDYLAKLKEEEDLGTAINQAMRLIEDEVPEPEEQEFLQLPGSGF